MSACPTKNNQPGTSNIENVGILAVHLLGPSQKANPSDEILLKSYQRLGGLEQGKGTIPK